ncbi:MAG: ABC transporter ATP-binding protein [Endomicrobia bacterium]|nr:ABC transporter ATP-binding protein [Endomicrobiia bacterium]
MQKDIILDVKNLNVSFNLYNKELFVLRDVSFTLYESQKIALVGESGSGKTTLGNTILLLNEKKFCNYLGNITFKPKKSSCRCKGEYDILRTQNGKVEIVDRNSIKHIRGNHISMIFQDPFSALNPVIRVGKQVEEVIKNHNKDISEDESFRKTLNLFQKVKLPQPELIYKKYPHQLSGGQIQRICIATAIANSPEILIADEPTTALDTILKDVIMQLITRLIKENNSSLILITHDIHLVKDYVDYVFILYAGEIIEVAKTKDIFENPLHPYTQLLLSCIIDISKKGHKLPTIPYNFPDISNRMVFNKCVFYNRCGKKIDVCEHEKPQLQNVNEATKVKCFLYM